MNKSKKVLLYSGGMDSWLMKQLWKPDVCLYVDMGTKYGNIEKRRLQKDIKIAKLEGIGQWERADKIIPMRNMYMLMAACNMYPNEDLQIALGATAGDRVLDKSEEFARKASDLLSYLYSPQWWCKDGRKVEVVLPYKQYTKEMLLREYVEKGGDLKQAFLNSFSCYNPSAAGDECWQCKPCIRKVIAFWSIGFREIKISTLKSVWKEVDERVMPLIKEGTYGRGKEEETAIKKFHTEVEEILKDWLQVEAQFDYGEILDEVTKFKKKWGEELILR